ncbi:hypothetical protein GGP62_003226 [Salinibacter ruber]|nr:hypothetical protein [Salinibacter ruber]
MEPVDNDPRLRKDLADVFPEVAGHVHHGGLKPRSLLLKAPAVLPEEGQDRLSAHPLDHLDHFPRLQVYEDGKVPVFLEVNFIHAQHGGRRRGEGLVHNFGPLLENNLHRGGCQP